MSWPGPVRIRGPRRTAGGLPERNERNTSSGTYIAMSVRSVGTALLPEGAARTKADNPVELCSTLCTVAADSTVLGYDLTRIRTGIAQGSRTRPQAASKRTR